MSKERILLALERAKKMGQSDDDLRRIEMIGRQVYWIPKEDSIDYSHLLWKNPSPNDKFIPMKDLLDWLKKATMTPEEVKTATVVDVQEDGVVVKVTEAPELQQEINNDNSYDNPKSGTKIPLAEWYGWVEFYLDKSTLDINIKVGDYESAIDKAKMKDIQSQLKKAEKMELKINKTAVYNSWRQMGDRVFLYWPTGTGKTHSVLARLEENKIQNDVVTVSDGFEDVDFLTYIFPTATWIQYKEKKIVELLRKAQAGEKVAILIDEANRWSKSFMNLLLKMIDPVSDCYEINNFVADEVIKVPKQNIIRFCTANLWWGYSGTNELDEALLDRFNKVSFVWYNLEFEKELTANFGDFDNNVAEVVTYIRKLFNDNELKRPISTRSLKIRAEDFIKTAQGIEDVFYSFERTVMYRLISVDSYGFPDKKTEGLLLSKFVQLWAIKKK